MVAPHIANHKRLTSGGGKAPCKDATSDAPAMEGGDGGQSEVWVCTRGRPSDEWKLKR